MAARNRPVMLHGMDRPTPYLRVPLNFQAPCLEQSRWHVFVILILSHPVFELYRRFILRWGQAQLFDNIFE